MSRVLIAFSGGVESTALIQKALVEGHVVVPCMINVHGNNKKRLAEITACERIIAAFEENKALYKGRIDKTVHMPVCPWLCTNFDNHPLAHNNITQQFAIVLGMLSIRRYYMRDDMPSTWIGWIKEDTSDYSFNEFDFTPEQYKTLLDLPKTIGKLSNADLSGCGFRAPLWNLTKQEILATIPDQIKPLLIPNADYYADEEFVTLKPYSGKITEWVRVGLFNVDEGLRAIVPEYRYSIADASFEARHMSGLLLPKDVDLENTHFNRNLVKEISPFLSKGKDVILQEQVTSLKREIGCWFRRITDID